MLSTYKMSEFFSYRDYPATALVIPVNGVGVMGAGLAKAAAHCCPEMYYHYQQECRAGRISLQQLGSYRATTGELWIYYPTKGHWRERSDMAQVCALLPQLRETAKALGAETILVPPLGCGLGGLDKGEVYARVREVFAEDNRFLWLLEE